MWTWSLCLLIQFQLALFCCSVRHGLGLGTEEGRRLGKVISGKLHCRKFLMAQIAAKMFCHFREKLECRKLLEASLGAFNSLLQQQGFFCLLSTATDIETVQERKLLPSSWLRLNWFLPVLSLHVQGLLPQWDLNLNNETSDGLDVSVDTLHQVTAALRKYYLPPLIALGLICNTLLVITVLYSKLRNFSVAPYLLTLAITDSLFLLSLLLIWISTLNIDIYNAGELCQAITFISYSCVFLSMWINVALAVDRYIMVRYPSQADNCCSTFRAKMMCVMFCVIAVAVYINISLLVGVLKTKTGDTICVPLPKFAHQVRTLSRVDVLVNIIIPMTAMCILNSIICCSVVQIDRNRKVVIRTVRVKNKTMLPDLNLQRRPRTEVRVTKMILAISWCYIVLNVPSHLFRICIMFKSFFQPAAVISNELFVWQQCLLFAIFTRFALTFPVLCAASQAFRKHVQSALFTRRARTPYRSRSRRKSVVLLQNGTDAQTLEDFM